MDDYEQKFRAYLQQHAIDAEWRVFSSSCHSVAEAAASAGVDALDVVKNICMIAEDDRLIVAIARGDDRISTTRLGKALGLPRPRVAQADEILQRTGYPCGGTPSFGYPALTLIDPRVMQRSRVLSGGGSTRSLLSISPAVLLAASGGEVVRVRR